MSPYVELTESLAARTVERAQGRLNVILVGVGDVEAGGDGGKVIMLLPEQPFPRKSEIDIPGAGWYVAGRMVDGQILTHLVTRGGVRRDRRWTKGSGEALQPEDMPVNERIPNVWQTSSSPSPSTKPPTASSPTTE